jgi:hypothetical protein
VTIVYRLPITVWILTCSMWIQLVTSGLAPYKTEVTREPLHRCDTGADAATAKRRELRPKAYDCVEEALYTKCPLFSLSSNANSSDFLELCFARTSISTGRMIRR